MCAQLITALIIILGSVTVFITWLAKSVEQNLVTEFKNKLNISSVNKLFNI